MHYLITAFALFLLVAFGAAIVGGVFFYRSPDWWTLGAGIAAAFIYLAIATKGFDTLRPPPGTMPGTKP